MKKSLVALAVLAASGASFAQTVTVYGIVDAWFGTTSGTGVASQTVLDSGGVSGSRWGLKGSEDLGGGLNANFVLENGFDVSKGAAAGVLFNRQAYVGFSGGFGEVKLGNVYTSYDDISGATNSAFDSALSAQNGVWASTNYISNPNNNIVYATPAMGGFSAAISYALGENAAVGVSASNVTAFNLQYSTGPVYVGFARQTETPVGGGTAPSFTRLNGSYDLGVAKVLLGYGKVSDQTMAKVTTPGAEITEWELGADVPVSAALTLSGGIARSSDNVVAGDASRSGYGFAAAYSLSKRTTVYGGFNSNTSTLAGVDTTNRTTAIGIKHTF